MIKEKFSRDRRYLRRNMEVTDAEFEISPTCEERYKELVESFLLKLEGRNDIFELESIS